MGIVSGAAMFTEPALMQSENPFAALLFLGMMAMMIRFAPKLMTASTANLPASDRVIATNTPTTKEEAVKFSVQGKERRGILTLPDAAGPYAALILLHGSDRAGRDASYHAGHAA